MFSLSTDAEAFTLDTLVATRLQVWLVGLVLKLKCNVYECPNTTLAIVAELVSEWRPASRTVFIEHKQACAS